MPNAKCAAVMWFVRAMTLPVGSILFTFPSLMGAKYARDLSAFEFLGLATVTIALMLYNLTAVLDWRRARRWRQVTHGDDNDSSYKQRE